MIIGLSVTYEWISVHEELELLAALGDGGPKRSGAGGTRNRIERFGPGVTGYGVGDRYELAIPGHLEPFTARLAQTGIIVADSITVNWYQPGQGISAHVDRRDAGDVIAILSLRGDATMRFMRGGGARVHDAACPRRSLLVLAQEARWGWRHSIPPVPDRRVSVVFRRAT